MDTSHSFTIAVKCGHCHLPINAQVWVIIDVENRLDLFESIARNGLNNFHCPNCKNNTIINDYPLLLFMPGNPRIGYSPVPGVSPEVMDRHIFELFQLLDEKLGGEFDENWITNGISVFPRENLSSTVRQALDIAPLMEDLIGPESLIDPVERANKIAQVLPLIEKEQQPDLWANLQNELGLSLVKQSSTSGDRKILLGNAITAHENALQIVTIESDPMRWSYMTVNLANALVGYSELLIESIEKEKTLEDAIVHMESVAKAWEDGDLWVSGVDLDSNESVFEQEDRIHVQLQAKIQVFSSLAETYKKRIKGDVKTNYSLAMDAYQKSLEDYYSYIDSLRELQDKFNQPITSKHYKFQMGWVVALANLGLAFLTKVDGDETDNVNRAIEYLEDALDIIDRSVFYKPTGTEVKPDIAMPTLRPQILKHLGVAYGKKGAKSDDPNFKKGMEYFDQAAAIWTYETHPRLWAGIMMTRTAIVTDFDPKSLNVNDLVELYNKCLEVVEKENAIDEWGKLTISLANVYLDYFQSDPVILEKAVSLLEGALEVFTSDAYPQERSIILQKLGDAQLAIHSEKQGIPLAREYYLAAITEVKNKGYSNREQNACVHLGEFEFELGNWDEAYQALRDAISINDQRLDDSFTESGSKRVTSDFRDIYDIAAYCLIMLNRYDEAIVAMENGRTRLLRRSMFSIANSDDHTNKLIKMRNEILELEREYSLPAGTPSRKSTKEISELLLACRSKFAIELKKSESFVPTLSAGDILQSIPPDTIFISFVSTSMGGCAILLPPHLKTIGENNIVLLPEMTFENHQMLAIGDKTRPGWLYSYLVTNMEHKRVSNKSWTEMIDYLTDRIWLEMINPIFTQIKQFQACNIVFVSSKMSQYLPLHAASTGNSEEKKYFMDFFESVTYIPSFHAYLTSKKDSLTKVALTKSMVVGVGKYLNGLSAIPNTVVESTFIASLLNTKPLLNENAIKEEVTKRIADSNIAHFACHGDFQWFGDVSQSGIHLYDSALTHENILRLNCRELSLLVLSACQTGVVAIDNVNESLGLVTAFMQSGAKSVISSLWLVEDLSTALLMMMVYENLLTMHPNAALLKAQKWLRSAKKDDLLKMINKIDKLNTPESRYLMSSGEIQDLINANSSYMPYKNPFYWGAFTYNGTITE